MILKKYIILRIYRISIALLIGHTMGPQVVKSKMDVLEVWL